MGRRMISIKEEHYKMLIKAKGVIELRTGVDITIGKTLKIICTVYLEDKELDTVLSEMGLI